MIHPGRWLFVVNKKEKSLQELRNEALEAMTDLMQLTRKLSMYDQLLMMGFTAYDGEEVLPPFFEKEPTLKEKLIAAGYEISEENSIPFGTCYVKDNFHITDTFGYDEKYVMVQRLATSDRVVAFYRLQNSPTFEQIMEAVEKIKQL